MTYSITPELSITPTSQAVACEVASDTVILDVPSGKYFALNGLGTVIWRRLEPGRTVSQLVEGLIQEYDVTREQCETEVYALIRQLAEHGLVTLQECARN
ncbi:MAG TPA: PqqD family protein [Bryobacteraceae bacterium]|nr:PqqD family protein [Bryobacteraceae bacterium]